MSEHVLTASEISTYISDVERLMKDLEEFIRDFFEDTSRQADKSLSTKISASAWLKKQKHSSFSYKTLTPASTISGVTSIFPALACPSESTSCAGCVKCIIPDSAVSR